LALSVLLKPSDSPALCAWRAYQGGGREEEEKKKRRRREETRWRGKSEKRKQKSRKNSHPLFCFRFHRDIWKSDAVLFRTPLFFLFFFFVSSGISSTYGSPFVPRF